MASVDDPRHKKLEYDVTNFLTRLGFMTDSAPYHDKMAKQISAVLQNIYTPTALYLRSRADKIAILPDPADVFEWEVKSHESKTQHDCCLEALPICHHLAKSMMDVECLYVYRNAYKGHELEVGFWVSKMPVPRIIMIPSRWEGTQLYQYFQEQFSRFFPNTKTIMIGRTRGGSDDPFLIIDESEMKKLMHWHHLIHERLGARKGPST